MERCRDDGNINSGSTSAGAAVNDAPPPPPPQLNTEGSEENRRSSPPPHSPNFWEKFLPAGRHSETIFRLHLMNFNRDVPGAGISRSQHELYQ